MGTGRERDKMLVLYTTLTARCLNADGAHTDATYVSFGRLVDCWKQFFRQTANQPGKSARGKPAGTYFIFDDERGKSDGCRAQTHSP